MSFFRRCRYSDIQLSITEHITETIEELMADGLTREEAELAARRSFGNRTLIEERSREIWQWPKLSLRICRRLHRIVIRPPPVLSIR